MLKCIDIIIIIINFKNLQEKFTLFFFRYLWLW